MNESELGTQRPDAVARIVLSSDSLGNDRVANQQRDREQAIADLQTAASFAPAGLAGPFTIHLAVQGGRLVLDVRTMEDVTLRTFLFALSPFRRLIKDYQLLVDSYEQAIHDGRTLAIQTIDMGRRGLHDEGAVLLIERLAGKIAIDFETARRLFTLVCVLHRRI
ncbi:MAG: UPF0262 family protein [Janthinobacterium lividum]